MSEFKKYYLLRVAVSTAFGVALGVLFLLLTPYAGDIVDVLIIALGLAHSEEALKAERAVTDVTNDLLKRNAEKLHQSTVAIAEESERGIIDIETLTHTNQELIATLDEVRDIQEKGHQKRIEAEQELGRIEGELKNKLLEVIKPQ